MPSSAESFIDLAQRPWLDVAPDISGAIVYLDTGAAEVVHVSLGAPFLFGLGAAHVCGLENAAPDDALLPSLTGQQPTTLVICITRLLTEAHPLILRAALAHPTASRVLILSSVSEHAHACQESVSGALGVEAFREYAEMLEQDVQDSRNADAAMSQQRQLGTAHSQKLAVSVRSFPMHVCALDASSFVLPSASVAATQSRAFGVAAGTAWADPAHTGMDEGSSPGTDLSLLAHELAGVVQQMGMRMEAWSLGPVSQQLALELTSLPLPVPPESNGKPAPLLGVVLVDRSLDATTPTYHHDSLGDMLLASLPRDSPAATKSRRPGGLQPITWRPLQARVDVPGLAPLLSGVPQALGSASACEFGAELVVPGDKQAVGRLEQVMAKKVKDGSALVRKWLKQSLAAEGLQPSTRSKAGAVTAGELAGLANDLIASDTGAGLRQRGAVTLGHAAAAVLNADVTARWEAVAAMERQLAAMLCGGGDAGGVVAVLQDALATAKSGKGVLTMPDIIAFLPALYSLTPDTPGAGGAGYSMEQDVPAPSSPFSAGEEAALQAAVVSALREAHGDDCEALGLVPGSADVEARVQGLFARLHGLAMARAHLPTLRRVTSGDVFGENVGVPLPLVRQLVRGVLNPQAEPIPDLVQARSESLAGMLTGGINKLGRFGLPRGLLGAVAGAVAGAGAGSRPSSPAQCDVVMVFVVGGISCAELREARQEMESLRNMQAAGDDGPDSGVHLPQLLLGGTVMLNSLDLVRCLL